MRALLLAGLLSSCFSHLSAQVLAPQAIVDSDHDGLSDALENNLLAQFAPQFMVSADDCSSRPAKFVPFLSQPEVRNENGVIYGQAFPRKGNPGEVELHYYHLWRRDCGEMSHPLDAEHVSALVIRQNDEPWKALYWYAAAHEDTVCDASQIARASTADGDLHGPTVWISRGKHASFLSDAICTHGCGGDICQRMQPLAAEEVINLGEPSHPMNGATWVGSPQWPLSGKMSRSDFTAARTARVENLPASTIVWANPGKRPMQAAILGGNGAVAGASTSLHATDTALDVAGSHTGKALDSASNRTGAGLTKTARSVTNALYGTARRLGLVPSQPNPAAHH